MQCWDGVQAAAKSADSGPSVVTVGSYDGVHRGHRAVIRCAVEHARERGAVAVVLTFDPHPLAVLRPGSEPAVLTERPQKARLLAGLGVAAACFEPFTPALAARSPEEFVEGHLVAALRAGEVVVGRNFRFGHRAAGDVDLLARLGERFGFAVTVLDLAGAGPGAGAGARPWSSTAARDLLAAGDVVAAAEVLGRPHRVEGPVVRGDGRGRGLGYPTANLGLAPRVAIPADGVYAGWLVRDLEHAAQRLPAAISVGTNPTFDGQQRRVEAYVITDPQADPDLLDLYDETVGVEFALRLRGMERFPTVEALIAQMARDVARAAGALT